MAVNIKKEFGQTRNRNSENSTLVYGKVPPQAPELEEAVLGAIMLERDKLEEVLQIIKTPEVFYVDAHQKIFSAIKALFETHYPVDLLTVTEQLKKQNELEVVGGPYFLTNLTMNVVSSAHVEAHSQFVVEKFIQRELIRISGQGVQNGYEDSVDPFMLVDNTITQLMDLLQSTIKNDPVHISHISKEVTRDAMDKRDQEIDYNGPRIGLRKIEEYLHCWQPGDLNIVGARPSVGKTAFMLQLAVNAATDLEAPTPVGIFSLEMQAASIVQRVQSNNSEVALKNIRRPFKMSQQDFDNYVNSSDKVGKMPIYIDDTAGITLTEFRAKAKKLFMKNGVKLFIIDYLQLMRGDGYNRENIISEISRGLKEIAKELDVTIIALSQLNRATAKAASNIPQLSDLRESGAIEQDADIVFLLHRASDTELKSHPELRGQLSVYIAKHRNGKTTEDEPIELHFQGHIQRITDSAQAEFDGFRPLTDAEKKGTSYENVDMARPSTNTGVKDDLPF